MPLLYHISDIHVASKYFLPELMERLIDEINTVGPDLVVLSGDLTDRGLRHEFEEAKAWTDRIQVPMLVTPGNHDSRNVGYIHFEELYGPRYATRRLEGVYVVAADSSEPDLDEGRIGRTIYPWLEEALSTAEPSEIKVFVTHHHLLPVPGAGRERNILQDAGDLLKILVDHKVDLVLNGHKHVPWVWRFEGMLIVNAGTSTTNRVRGRGRPSYTVIEIDGGEITVRQRYFDGTEETEHRHRPGWRVEV
ncbi:metallophosphoesterase family protein [Marinithermus hydrothermalis]|uniref:Metallophosphoesterase n=1 Tax=Marinithermus hydrothermalis (strain DSM 14884 / JCM 11576 / T1) TaxID=869210 RepID=F2NQA5_MARHT|nr:metallophosphoesterase [Marinithermus hydrothermalis]AEB11632.1 metallophosphoesterase [Marinithermus hydrothermalis DSM 14884]